MSVKNWVLAGAGAMKLRHLLLIVAGIVSLYALLLLTNVNPGDAGHRLVKGTLGLDMVNGHLSFVSANAISGTLRETCPLLIAGIAVFIALQAGLFNIGVEGQLIVGALTCAAIALRIPGIPGIVLGTIGAVIMGAVWALPAGLIRAYRGGHEVITTIMLNSVAIYVTNGIVSGPLKDVKQESPTTPTLADSSRLPFLYNTSNAQISSGILIGLLLLVAFAFWLRRFVSGYELRAVGSNPVAAKLAGVKTAKTIVMSMVVSGGIAGLAGAVQVLGYTFRYYQDFSQGYGFNALGVALLAGSNPLGIIPAAFFFGLLTKGSSALQVLGIPKDSGFVVLGLLIIVFATIRYRKLISVTES
ncbi:MAG TPA: ABC transporter permease [Fimbriimonadaceae bacterium]|jgi:simple sugar transport system permease protein